MLCECGVGAAITCPCPCPCPCPWVWADPAGAAWFGVLGRDGGADADADTEVKKDGKAEEGEGEREGVCGTRVRIVRSKAVEVMEKCGETWVRREDGVIGGGSLAG